MVQAEEMATHRPEGNPECSCVCVLVHACMCGLMRMHTCTCVYGVCVFMCTYMNLYLHVDMCAVYAQVSVSACMLCVYTNLCSPVCTCALCVFIGV